MAIVQGWGAAKWKTYCDPLTLGSPTFGWGGGRQWRMHRTAKGNDRLEGWAAAADYKLFCNTPAPPPP